MDAVVDAVGAFFEALAKVITFTVKAVGVSALIIVYAFATAIVVRDYWNWFVAPLGLSRIGLLHAFGLAMFIGFLRTDYSTKTSRENNDNSDRDSPVLATVGAVFGMGLVWAAGWLTVTFGGPF